MSFSSDAPEIDTASAAFALGYLSAAADSTTSAYCARPCKRYFIM